MEPRLTTPFVQPRAPCVPVVDQSSNESAITVCARAGEAIATTSKQKEKQARRGNASRSALDRIIGPTIVLKGAVMVISFCVALGKTRLPECDATTLVYPCRSGVFDKGERIMHQCNHRVNDFVAFFGHNSQSANIPQKG